MGNTKKYNIDGVEKGTLDLTIEEVSTIIETQKIDEDFLEIVNSYLWREDVEKLTKAKQNHTEELFDFFVTRTREGETEEGKRNHWLHLRKNFWDLLSEHVGNSQKTLKKYEKYLNWSDINRYGDISIIENEFPEKLNQIQLDWNYMYRKRYADDLLDRLKANIGVVRPLTKEEFKKHVADTSGRVNLRYLTRCSVLSKELLTYIGSHLDEVELMENILTPIELIIGITKPTTDSDKLSITADRVLTEEEINEYADYLSWNYLCRYRKLTEKTIIKNIDKINWYETSIYQNLSKGFILNHKTKLYPDLLVRNENIPLETLCDIDHIVENYSDDMMDRSDATEDFVRKVMEGLEKEPHWPYISINKNMSGEFLLEHKDKVDWVNVSRHGKLSEEFINNNLDILDLESLVHNRNISLKLIKKLEEINSVQYKF